MENKKRSEVKVGKEIRRRRKALGLTMMDLVDRIEQLGGSADQGNLSRIERDQQGYTQETLGYIAHALDCKIADLFYGVEGYGNVDTMTSTGTKRVPIINYIQAGRWTEIAHYIEDELTEFIITDSDLSKNSFALRIKGDSMADKFLEGDVIVIDPEINPMPGDFVVATNHEHEATFKKYRPRGMNEKGQHVFELVPLNDDYPTLRSDVSPMKIVGVMIEHRRYRRK